MSRPNSSVPNQCAPLGGWSREGKSMLLGFCGAIHGANCAKVMNTATSTMPMDASTLRRPNVAAVFHVVESAIAIKAHKLNREGRKRRKGNRFRNFHSFASLALFAVNGFTNCQLLFANCWFHSHQLLQRAKESLILFRRANAHAYGVRSAPRR